MKRGEGGEGGCSPGEAFFALFELVVGYLEVVVMERRSTDAGRVRAISDLTPMGPQVSMVKRACVCTQKENGFLPASYPGALSRSDDRFPFGVSVSESRFVGSRC